MSTEKTLPFKVFKLGNISTAAFQKTTDEGVARPPFVLLGKSSYDRKADAYKDESLLLSGDQVPAAIRCLKEIEAELLKAE